MYLCVVFSFHVHVFRTRLSIKTSQSDIAKGTLLFHKLKESQQKEFKEGYVYL